MAENPFRFTGPLNPHKDRMICAPRSEEIKKISDGIKRRDYWSVLGPRQIGKTTLLFQLSKTMSPSPCIYIHFEIKLPSRESFYEMIMNEVREKIPVETAPDYKEQEKFGPEYYFLGFLKSIKSRDNQPIVFMFDEIGRVPYVKSFLGLWRKVFHDRNYHRELEKYAVIISGAEDLVSLTYGPSSPFNISRKLLLSNLETGEAQRIVDIPMKALKIAFEPGIKERLISEAAGHPQLLQHLCYLAVEEITAKKSSVITGPDLDKAIAELFKRNSNLETLKNQVKIDENLHSLLGRILYGEKIKYLTHQDYSKAGVGPIIEDDEKFCKLRSPLYREYLTEIMDFVNEPPEQFQKPPAQTKTKKQDEFVTTVCCSSIPEKFDSQEQEKAFLQQLFSERVKIKIGRNGVQLGQIGLSSKEKFFLCYLAYKNYKTINEGFSDWKSIPVSYKYRVSSILENNEEQKPEWEIFKKALKKAGVEHFVGDEIKAWVFSIRKKLAGMDAKELIHSTSGKGSGYLLTGTVKFGIY